MRPAAHSPVSQGQGTWGLYGRQRPYSQNKACGAEKDHPRSHRCTSPLSGSRVRPCFVRTMITSMLLQCVRKASASQQVHARPSDGTRPRLGPRNWSQNRDPMLLTGCDRWGWSNDTISQCLTHFPTFPRPRSLARFVLYFSPHAQNKAPKAQSRNSS